MIKRALVLPFIVLFPFLSAFACSCDKPATNDRFMISEFVGIVEVVQTSEGKADQRYYKADLKVIESFKGIAPDRIRVSGTTSEVYSGQCEISVEKGEQWLLFMNDDGESFYLSHCSHPLRIADKNGKPEKLTDIEQNEIEQLQFFREHVPNLHSEKIIAPDQAKIWKFLQQFDHMSFENHTSYFLIDFNKDLDVLDIETLRGFSEEVDPQIEQYFKNKAEWQIGYMGNQDISLDKNTQYIFTLRQNASE